MQEFLSFLRKGYDLGDIVKQEANPIAAFSPHTLKLGKQRVLLVGDASFLANPFTGEGIYGALISGRAAGESIAENLFEPSRALKAYKQKLKPLLSKMKQAYSLWTYYLSLNRETKQSFVKDYFGISSSVVE